MEIKLQLVSTLKVECNVKYQPRVQAVHGEKRLSQESSSMDPYYRKLVWSQIFVGSTHDGLCWFIAVGTYSKCFPTCNSRHVITFHLVLTVPNFFRLRRKIQETHGWGRDGHLRGEVVTQSSAVKEFKKVYSNVESLLLSQEKRAARCKHKTRGSESHRQHG